MESYVTVFASSAWEQVIDKSRFIGVVHPVTTVEEVEQRLQEIRQKYPNARHYVYAYRLYQGRLEKSTDDGEPQGTGGRPILDVLQYRQIWDALIVVIRYFGGVLLGTGGLSRAYGSTARQLMDDASIGKLIPHQIYELEAGYEWYEQLKYWFKQYSWAIGKEEFLATVTLQVNIPWEQKQRFLEWLADFTDQQIVPREVSITLCPD